MTRQITAHPSKADSSELRMTYQQFLRKYMDRPDRVEWVDGKVEAMAAVSNWHSELQFFVGGLLRVFVDARHPGFVGGEQYNMKTGANLPGRSPDLMVVLEPNRHRVKTTHLAGPADLVIEIVSPGARKRDREVKYAEYEAGGVREYWVIDPQLKLAEFFQLIDACFSPIPVGEDGIFHSLVLDGLWLDVNWLWQSPLPSTIEIIKRWKII